MNTFVHLRRPAALLLTGVTLLALTACGPAAGKTASGAPAADPSSSSAASPSAATSTPRVTTSTAAPPTPVDPDSSAGRKAFAQGLASYCTQFYVDQRTADEQYPGGDPASLVGFAQTSLEATPGEEEILAALTPPHDLASSFAKFMASVQAVHKARSAALRVTSAAEYDASSAALNAAIRSRYPLAETLGAARCDGQLTAKERAAVVAVTRSFSLTADSSKGCDTMVTPEYVANQWVDQADPMAACIADRTKRQRNPRIIAKDITVNEVTGVDGSRPPSTSRSWAVAVPASPRSRASTTSRTVRGRCARCPTSDGKVSREA